jgi:hypothetical protein
VCNSFLFEQFESRARSNSSTGACRSIVAKVLKATARGRILLWSDRGGSLRNSRFDSPDDVLLLGKRHIVRVTRQGRQFRDIGLAALLCGPLS